MAQTLLNIKKDGQGSSYSATISLRCTDMGHQILLEQHGPVEVECGGSFTETIAGPTVVNVVLSSTLRDFPDQFAYTQTFTADQFAGDHQIAMNQLDAWVQHMTKSDGIIQTALDVLWTSVGGVDYDDDDTVVLTTP